MKNLIDKFLLDDNGKDDRLKILENGMTKYGCKPKPYPHLSYSSCTASTISLEAYTYLKNYFNDGIFDRNKYIEEFQNIRDDIRKIIGLKDEVDICLANSGTDLEILPYMFIPKNSDVINIVIAPNEVGSGTSLAVEGRVFSNVNDKYRYRKGDLLEGFDKFNIKVFNLSVRDERGQSISDKELLNQIDKILKNNKNKYKIVHCVYHSKTGLIKPIPEDLLNLNLDEKTIVIIDACQFRISREKVNDLLDRGCMVFITGSKFFAGPTFSAAALIPSNLRDIAAYNKDVPKGINFLFGREFFPKRWKSVENFEYSNSIGLLLRWRAAIFEMQLFNSIAKDRIMETIKIFNKSVKKVIEDFKDFIIYSDISDDNEMDYNLLMSNTILTFGFKDKSIDIEKAKDIYKKLISNEWLNKKYPYSVHLGQPVKIIKENGRWLGTLRIALSSKFFVNNSGKIKSIQKDIIEKELEYIFSSIKRIY
jgi:hypothetical protein